MGTEGVRSGEGDIVVLMTGEAAANRKLWPKPPVKSAAEPGASAASVEMREPAGTDALISPGGKAHSVQAEGKMDFSDPSPVFQKSPFLSLYIFLNRTLFYPCYGI